MKKIINQPMAFVDEMLEGVLLAYAHEVEERIAAQFAALEDADLARSYPGRSAATHLGHYVYALRHTMHHHGSLATLAVHHGLAGGSWA